MTICQLRLPRTRPSDHSVSLNNWRGFQEFHSTAPHRTDAACASTVHDGRADSCCDCDKVGNQHHSLYHSQPTAPAVSCCCWWWWWWCWRSRLLGGVGRLRVMDAVLWRFVIYLVIFLLLHCESKNMQQDPYHFISPPVSPRYLVKYKISNGERIFE